MDLTFHPVTQSHWPDFEQFVEARGGPHYCWCMAWRRNECAGSIPGKAGKKAAMKARVDAGVPIGLLAYFEGKPIGWCSVAPRDTYKRLGGDESRQGVWSIACFFIKRPFRKQGVSRALLDAAIAYAKQNKANYLEAYPPAADSPSYQYMGSRSAFEQSGFEFVKMAGSRRHVMLLCIQ